MKKLLVSVCLCILAVTAFCQQRNREKVVYGEFVYLSGLGVITANFDSRFAKKQDGLGYHLGAGILSGGSTTVFIIPVGLNFLKGKKAPHYFEGGLGVNIITDKDYGSSAVFVPSIGYRYQRKVNGVSFRFFLAPWISQEFLLAGGISIGYKF